MNKKKMFIISDIHGHYDEMIKALEGECKEWP